MKARKLLLVSLALGSILQSCDGGGGGTAQAGVEPPLLTPGDVSQIAGEVDLTGLGDPDLGIQILFDLQATHLATATVSVASGDLTWVFFADAEVAALQGEIFLSSLHLEDGTFVFAEVKYCLQVDCSGQGCDGLRSFRRPGSPDRAEGNDSRTGRDRARLKAAATSL